jgi:thiamine biosynthesis lipoprotein
MRCLSLSIAWLLGITASLAAADPTILTLSGATMGTTYSVKIFDPPEFDDDIQFDIDAELRSVNDQMSTYLQTSEISRFNQSESTDWFDVSPDFARVVDFAQSVSKKTDGAFDITISPLVNAWNFGPSERTNKIPAAETIEKLRESVGYEQLSVRLDPPALKKSRADLTIDLSAIAKGHGVDRLVDLLGGRGAQNVFIEIGGEVRVAGDKAGQWWKVGIQVPDSDQTEVMIAHSLNTGSGNDQSMATSGDYRNFFEVDGSRYSHTIDPRTGRPVNHDLASVSVVTKGCMQADAWATAINVLGADDGLAIAKQENLDVLLVRRDGDSYEKLATGAMTAYASAQPLAKQDEVGRNNTFAVMLITFVVFAILLFAMSVGVMLGRRSISGSCGGLANTKDADGNVSCSFCSNPADACKELQERMQKPEPL